VVHSLTVSRSKLGVDIFGQGEALTWNFMYPEFRKILNLLVKIFMEVVIILRNFVLRKK
jgi:hypothetical protein